MPGLGNELIDIILFVVAVPQLFVTVYIIVSVPAITPVTIPASTEALVFVADHVPPIEPSVKVIDAAGQTVDKPLIIPAFGRGFTVTIFDAVTVPQELVIVY